MSKVDSIFFCVHVHVNTLSLVINWFFDSDSMETGSYCLPSYNVVVISLEKQIDHESPGRW